MNDELPRSPTPEKPQTRLKSKRRRGNHHLALRDVLDLFIPIVVASWLSTVLVDHIPTLRTFSVFLSISLYFALYVFFFYVFHWAQRRLVSYVASPIEHAEPKPKTRGRWLLGIFLTVIVLPLFLSLTSDVLKVQALNAISAIFRRNPTLPVTAILANAILSSTDVYTKMAGIESLGDLETADAAMELFRISKLDKVCLNHNLCRGEIARALKRFKNDAISERLIAEIQVNLADAKIAGEVENSSSAAERFQSEIDLMRKNIQQNGRDDVSKRQQIAKLDGLEALIGETLEQIETRRPFEDGTAALVNLYLEAYAKHEGQDKNDSTMKQLAKQISTDFAFSSSTRQRAISLVGNLATSEDLEWITKMFESKEEPIKAVAMRAFGEVVSRDGKVQK